MEDDSLFEHVSRDLKHSLRAALGPFVAVFLTTLGMGTSINLLTLDFIGVPMSARAAMLAKAHIARKDLALTEDTYRAIVLRITGHASAAAASDAGLDALLAEFARLGWRPRKGRAPSNKPHVRKIYAIWKDLAPLLDEATEETLCKFVRRQTRSLKSPAGIARPEWLDGVEGAKVIEGLKGWLARERALRLAERAP